MNPMSKSASFHIFSYLISDINCSFRLSPSVHRNHGVREKKPKHRHIEDDYDFIDLGSPIKPVSSPKSNPDVPKEKDKDKDWIFPLSLSLEDLCLGASHRYRITRNLRSGKSQNVKIDVKVSPGWKKGTRIRVPGVGNERRDGTFQDIVFVVEEEPHSRFKRVDNDLYVTAQIPWQETTSRPYSWTSEDSDLDGKRGRDSEEVAFVRGIDGQEFALPIPRSLVEGADGSRIIGAGMPIRSHGQVDGRGDLVVK